jgi:sugar lactone lactonase YvrE
VNGVLALLAAVVALGAGDYPPAVDASSPAWSSVHTLQFAYRQDTWTPTRYAASDDGTGFAPAGAPSPDPTVSPDGGHRYSVDPLTRVLSIDGVSTRRAVHSLGPSSVAWSPDSSRLAFASAGRIWVIGADGSGRRAVHAGTTVAWASTEELVVGVGDLDADVYTMRPDGTRPRRILTGYSSPGGLAVSPDGTQLAFTASFSAPHVYGSALYVAVLGGLDQDVRRISPDICSVRGCPDTDGPDSLVGTKAGDLIIGGAGNDGVRAGDGQNVVYGQWGDDTILTGSYVDTVYGGGGNDVIRTGAGEDFITPGPGRDVVDAGRGPDHVIANDGERDVIDCGPGDDRARVDRIDVVGSCEHVTVVS